MSLGKGDLYSCYSSKNRYLYFSVDCPAHQWWTNIQFRPCHHPWYLSNGNILPDWHFRNNKYSWKNYHRKNIGHFSIKDLYIYSDDYAPTINSFFYWRLFPLHNRTSTSFCCLWSLLWSILHYIRGSFSVSSFKYHRIYKRVYKDF